MKNKLRKIFLSFVGIFILMFVLRLGYGFLSYPTSQMHDDGGIISNLVDQTRSLTNIASTKYELKKGEASNAEVISVDQKYEKTATLSCKSNKFEEDEESLRKTIADEGAIIQFQQTSGNEGYRRIYMQIGVQPDRFDNFIDQMNANQNVLSLSVTKKDKTNEYRELDSKIKTLQMTRSSLIELKSKGGQIAEYINLENRILEIDEQLQQLGVQMGSYDSENEFCTVKLSLREGQIKKISIFQRLKVALEWTIKYYLMFTFSMLLALGGAFLIVLILDKLKVFKKIVDKFS